MNFYIFYILSWINKYIIEFKYEKVAILEYYKVANLGKFGVATTFWVVNWFGTCSLTYIILTL